MFAWLISIQVYREQVGASPWQACEFLPIFRRIDHKEPEGAQIILSPGWIDPPPKDARPADAWSAPDRDHRAVRAKCVDVPPPVRQSHALPSCAGFRAVPSRCGNGSGGGWCAPAPPVPGDPLVW